MKNTIKYENEEESILNTEENKTVLQNIKTLYWYYDNTNNNNNLNKE